MVVERSMLSMIKPMKFHLLILSFLFLVSCGPATPSPIGNDPVRQYETIPPVEIPIETTPTDAVSGIVVDEAGNPVGNATVRLQATSLVTTTGSDGKFFLNGINKNGPIRLTAFSQGYFIKEATTVVGTSGIKFSLVAHATEDNPVYVFLTAGLKSTTDEVGTGCAKCHAASKEEAAQGITLPFDEWLLDAHASSSKNPRFLSMYNGTDLQGNQSPLTTYVSQKDYGQVPLRPTVDDSYFGPGFKLDFPQKTGNCASCHLPVAAVNSPYDTDPNKVSGIGLEGVTCDFCHKVWDVDLNTETKQPNNNMPGVLSLGLRRPSDEHQLFIGPFDDVAPGEDTYSPLQNKSDFCAPCHSGDFWDIKIYNSYGEWLASPYSNQNGKQFKTCQDCHMPPLGMDHFAKIENGGLIRDPKTVFSHKILGASDVDLLQNTAELNVSVTREGDLITVSTSVFNANGGHHIPTDSPLRQILLSVKAFDKDAKLIPLKTGPILPDWTGDYKNSPGIYFAKILEELWTENAPTGSYWMQTRIMEDTRLPALETRKAEFVFEYPQGSSVTIDASLIFRRAFYDLIQQKGWNTPDILMEQKVIELP